MCCQVILIAITCTAPFDQFIDKFYSFFIKMATLESVNCRCWTVDHLLCGEQAVSSLVGVSILVFITCVVILVLNPRWRRVPLPEEESLHHLTNAD